MEWQPEMSNTIEKVLLVMPHWTREEARHFCNISAETKQRMGFNMSEDEKKMIPRNIRVTVTIELEDGSKMLSHSIKKDSCDMPTAQMHMVMVAAELAVNLDTDIWERGRPISLYELVGGTDAIDE